MEQCKMIWFTKNKKKNSIQSPEDMTPLQAVTHLCACIQLSDGDADFEERKAWLNAISTLFPSYSEERADKFLFEAHAYLKSGTKEDYLFYTEKVLSRIKAILNEDQIKQLGPKLKALIEADGIVMTAEMEIANLIEQYLSIQIDIDQNL
jgi:uncharacterized tellurite resistance protein B-like protein